MAMRAAQAVRAGRAARTAGLVMVVLAVVSLGSCQVLQFVFGSVFPSTTGLIKAQASLAAQIPSSNNTPFTIRVVETGGFGYVVVIGTLTDTGTTAFFFDLDLNPKATFTNLVSNGVGVDSSGLIAVGSLLLNPNLTQNSTMTSPVSLGSNDAAGVDIILDASVPPHNLTNFSLSGATFNRSSYASGWTGQLALPAAPVISATQTSLRVDAVLDDGGANVILVVSPSTGNNGNGESSVTAYFLTAPKATITATATLTNLLDTSPHRDNMDGRSFGFAQGSIFAFDSGSSSYVRIDPSTASTQASYYGTDPSNTRFAYRVSGGSFYGYDSKARALTKYAAWW